MFSIAYCTLVVVLGGVNIKFYFQLRSEIRCWVVHAEQACESIMKHFETWFAWRSWSHRNFVLA